MITYRTFEQHVDKRLRAASARQACDSMLAIALQIACGWHIACAQVPDGPEKAFFHTSPASTIDVKRQLSTAPLAETIITYEGRRLEALYSERLAEELGLEGEQVKQLKAEKRRVDKLNELALELRRALLPSRTANPQSQRLTDQIKDERQALDDAISACLLPHQQKRLAQLAARRTAAERGLETDVAARFAWEAPSDDPETAETRKALSELRTLAEVERAGLRRLLREEIERILTGPQREMLQRECGEFGEYSAPSREILSWQLSQSAPADAEVRPVQRLEELFRASPNWRASLAGGVEQAMRVPVDYFQHVWMLAVNGTYGAAEVVNFQLLAAGEANAEERQRHRDLQGKLGELTRQELEGTLTLETFNAEAAKLTDEFALWRAQTRLAVLLPHQRLEVDRIILRRLIALRGIKLCLTAGALGELLGITASQRRQIEDISLRLVEQIDQSARVLEHRTWARVREALPSEERGRFSEIYGAHSMTEKLKPTPDLLLLSPSSQSPRQTRP